MSILTEIICVGNELLIGKTLNTNAQWLAKRVTTLGLKVHRIVTVDDDINEITSSIKESIERENDLIVTIGGLGPTFDDKTLKGVAKAIGRKLEIHKEALSMVKEKYSEYLKEGRIETAELTSYRLKMARLPEGAEALINPVGTAPGVLIKYKNAILIALPGIPSEMKAIFEYSVAPIFRRLTSNVTFFATSLHVRGIVESEIAPLIEKVMKDNPQVYIKSHPKDAERILGIELHASTTAKESYEAKNRISKALIQISQLIQERGGNVRASQRKSVVKE
jgi:molybdenum cofactor synthesis domain-containing protein